MAPGFHRLSLSIPRALLRIFSCSLARLCVSVNPMRGSVAHNMLNSVQRHQFCVLHCEVLLRSLHKDTRGVYQTRRRYAQSVDGTIPKAIAVSLAFAPWIFVAQILTWCCAHYPSQRCYYNCYRIAHRRKTASL